MSALLDDAGRLDLDAVRAHLGTELKGILARHGKISAHLQNIDRDMPDDWQEAAQLMENDEVLEALEESSRTRIHQLRAALRRLETGSYAHCVGCGEDIGARRLAAMPTATRCVACAS